MSQSDETRPIQCVACGRSFASPRWFGARGPLCGACHDRLEREERVHTHHRQKPSGTSLRSLIRAVRGR
jgi:hypothetical protein